MSESAKQDSGLLRSDGKKIATRGRGVSRENLEAAAEDNALEGQAWSAARLFLAGAEAADFENGEGEGEEEACLDDDPVLEDVQDVEGAAEVPPTGGDSVVLPGAGKPATVVVPYYDERAPLGRLASNEDSQYILVETDSVPPTEEPGASQVPAGHEDTQPIDVPATQEERERTDSDEVPAGLVEAVKLESEPTAGSGKTPGCDVGEEIEDIKSDDEGRGTFQERNVLPFVLDR